MHCIVLQCIMLTSKIKHAFLQGNDEKAFLFGVFITPDEKEKHQKVKLISRLKYV